MTRIQREPLAKAYDPSEFETAIYERWLEADVFPPDGAGSTADPALPPFVIIQPPPNITGSLHLGHGQRTTVEDLMIRHARMLGRPALFLPGLDHASIAAQFVLDGILAKEGESRQSLGRDRYLERMRAFIDETRQVILTQQRRLGGSCDWGRLRYTLDEGSARAVRVAFKTLYDRDLAYRAEALVNWCPGCRTSVSDLEVVPTPESGTIWRVRYHLLQEGSGQPDPDRWITVATTRPETILGDTAVAVYPDDARYQALVGGTRRQVTRAVEEGFPITPPGCAIRLDRLSQDIVLENLKSATWSSRKALAQDLRQLPASTRLPDFLQATGRDIADIYVRPSAGHSFTTLRAMAFARDIEHGEPGELDRAFGRLLHVDDNERFDAWLRWLSSKQAPAIMPLHSRGGRLQGMLFAALGGRSVPLTQMASRFATWWADDSRRDELFDLLSVLRDQARADTQPLDPLASRPLHSHATYSLYEIVAASGMTSSNGMLRDTREGVVRVETDRTDLFFVTLEKSEGDYSPTTKYEDYPISPTLFHWESQSTTSPGSKTGQRYIHHRRTGDRVVLFVRERKRDSRGETIPYTCLGYANYVSHESSRPMRITWRLERPMPARFYQEAKVAAG